MAAFCGRGQEAVLKGKAVQGRVEQGGAGQNCVGQGQQSWLGCDVVLKGSLAQQWTSELVVQHAELIVERHPPPPLSPPSPTFQYVGAGPNRHPSAMVCMYICHMLDVLPCTQQPTLLAKLVPW